MIQTYILPLPSHQGRTILACGADTKGSFAFAKGRSIYIRRGYGDLGDIDNFNKYKKDMGKIIGVKTSPDVIVRDLHPQYFSSGFAEELHKRYPKSKILSVQHHRAHIASAIMENGIKGKILGVAFDGTGYGDDGHMWGGEVFRGDINRLDRIARLEYVAMPGGESSVRNPWQMALSYLYSAFGKDVTMLKIPFLKCINEEKTAIVLNMIRKGFNSPKTSSMGRLFDGVSSMLGLVCKNSFEAEAPVRLERKAMCNTEDFYHFSIEKKGLYVVGMRDIIRALVKDVIKGRKVSYVASKFHNTVVEIIVDICRKTKINTVVLSGGVFMNKIIRDKTSRNLKRKGFDVFMQKGLNTTDEGIALGQIAFARKQ